MSNVVLRIEVLQYFDRYHEALYRGLIDKLSSNFIYSTIEFMRFLDDCTDGKPLYIVAIDNNEMVGILPLFHIENVDGNVVLNSLPWYGSYGGCLVARDEEGSIRRALLHKFSELSNYPNVISSVFIPDPFEYEVYKIEYDKNLIYRTKQKKTGQISILPKVNDPVEDALMGIIKQKTRNLVRKSLKQGFCEIVTDEDWAWEFLFQTHKNNMLAVGGKAKPRSHFKALKKHLPISWRRLSVAMLDNKPVAAMLLFKYKSTIEYITPVIDVAYRSSQPLSFLIWHGMREAIENNYKVWNWGATWESQKSLHHFKAGWGAEDKSYEYFIISSDNGYQYIKKNMSNLGNDFPYFFLYPFS